MALFKKKSPEEKEFENKLKALCGGVTNNDTFREKLESNGLSKNTPNIQYKNLLKSEYRYGKLTIDTVEERLDELLSQNLSSNELINMNSELSKEQVLIKREKAAEDYVEKILEDKKVAISIPEKMDAIQGAALGGLAFGKTGMALGALTGGETTWRSTKLLISDTGLTIQKNGQSITFEEIINLEVSRPGGFSKPIFSLTSKFGNNMIFNCGAAKSLEIILRERISKVSSDDSGNNVDDLLKYAELYEKGLLTEEEFEAKKKELL